MTVAASNALAALSVLTSTNGFADYASSVATESRAVRLAKAAFTAKPSATPPWKQPATTTPLSSQLTAIRAMKTIIDPPAASFEPAQADVQTSFVTYKALDRLRLLATAAAKITTSAADRAGLQSAFNRGLADLHAFLATAATDRVELSFGLPTHRAESVAIQPATATKIEFAGVNAVRGDPVAGLTGSEQFRITLTKPGGSDTVAVDLSQGPQPPTLDSVAGAINAAIGAIPARNADGSLLLDDKGATVPKWSATIAVDNSSGKWGLSVQAPSGVEQVAIDQVGAPDALVVAGGQTAAGAAPATRLWRMNDAGGAMTRQTLGDMVAIERNASAAAKLTAAADAAALAAARKTVTTAKAPAVTPASTTVFAPTTTAAIVTDASGASYSVGTTSGDIGTNLSNGNPDLFVTKRDSEGAVVWQRNLGATAGAQGAAITLTSAGNVVVAGTVTGAFDGATTDGDMVVASFSAAGDEQFTTTVRAGGSDTATAVAVGHDGSIYLGGRAASGGGDAFLARLDPTGKLVERRTIDSGGSDLVKALAIGADGNPLAVISENGTSSLHSFAAGSLATDVASVTLGNADVRAIAVAADGTIAVGGSTSAALAGRQANALAGGRDGFVTTLDATMGNARTVYVGSGSDDQVDSVAFMNGAIYAGGRTTGSLDGAALRGSVDGFVSRIDTATGAVAATSQFGMTALRAEPVIVAAAPGGSTALGALGLHRGTLNPPASAKLVAQTSLRAGDEFSIRLEGGTLHKIVITAADTLATLAARIRSATGSKATITVAATRTVPVVAGAVTGSTSTATALPGSPSVLRIDAQGGHSIELVAGSTGKDALAKLGLAPARLSVPTVVAAGAPRVRPGGNFGLALTDALTIATIKDAAVTLASLKSATSMTQTAYRSLYWDAGKAKVVDGSSAAGVQSSYQKAQLAGYQAALARLTPVPDTSTTTTTYTGF